MSNKKQLGIYIDSELFDSIKLMSDKSNHSVNKTIVILLEYAIKDKTRKRKPKKVSPLSNPLLSEIEQVHL